MRNIPYRFITCLGSALIIATLLLADGVDRWPAAASTGMGPPIPMTAAQFANASTGQNVEVLIKVDSFERTTLRGHLAEYVKDSSYRLTSQTVTFFCPPDVQVVMGSADDIKPGSAVYVYAVVTSAGHADAKKAVVVTQYTTFL